MLIFPAIDLMSGQVVRLRQGKADQKTVYSSDPAAFAKKWEEEGGDGLHIVDLDAAFSGVSKNLDFVKKITAAISIPCELSAAACCSEGSHPRQTFDAGVARIVISTRACEIDAKRNLWSEMVEKFGGEKIAVGIDAKNGIVSVKGWTETSNIRAVDLAKIAEKAA